MCDVIRICLVLTCFIHIQYCDSDALSGFLGLSLHIICIDDSIYTVIYLHLQRAVSFALASISMHKLRLHCHSPNNSHDEHVKSAISIATHFAVY